MNRSSARPRSGAALLLSLWALFLLSAVVISWALDIDSRLTLNGNANGVLEAEAMAASGSEIAIHPAVKSGSSLLRGDMSRTQSFKARIIGEGGRLNLNFTLLQNGQRNEAFIEVLDRFLALKDVELNDRARMVDCLVDWLDPDNVSQLNGAEDDANYHPPNRGKLLTVDELKRVRGWEEFTSGLGWDADLTINSLQRVDVRWASRDVLLALGLGEQAVDGFLQLRRGSDALDGTEDDPQLTEDEAWAALGVPTPQQRQQLFVAPYESDPVMRVVSVGRSGDVTRTVEMIIRKPKNGAASMVPGTWKEL